MQLLLTAAIELIAVGYTLLLTIEFGWGIYERWQDVVRRTEFSPCLSLWDEYRHIFECENASAALLR
ncbi:MAG: hypothetical protein CLLPBCKN_006938 [Chroococcidiopsis cubana SAG 39.79]|uniref:Uncharacterized protein n=1 Tax=Chroococcidiopsis cubana SAG 39.79 TaxID=388085 RepID=A0AB37U7U0_9CYAN|nr:hypothetical protein [Chroococcidiopsis cubana]MDZ4877503.1 hypothetical protein [Chroococcidiopsis cubana SAG 39.79]PSB55886.1 hypothetical protein C7B79_32895 [Chroococcidiopsis cubana CCALA 043]RUS95935.1 hypothetical protein DSM107010_71020 [Chroococcidiopsis cubana SAG 39.79]